MRTTRVFGPEDEKACVQVCLLKDIEELGFPWNRGKKLKVFNNSPRIGIKPLENRWDLLDTRLWGNNLK